MAEFSTYAALLDRTVATLRRTLRDLGVTARDTGAFTAAPDLPDGDSARLREQLARCLNGRGGEVSARARAVELGRTYLALNPTGRERFLEVLATGFDAERATVDKAAEALGAAKDEAARRSAEAAMRGALEPPRLKLLTQFNALPDGVKFLVDMRAELIQFGRKNPALALLEGDLRGLLASWFDVGFLELRRITWSSPADVLEKLIAYEAVHEIRDWGDLKNRLDSDRRCYAFFHPRMPKEPLIFVEVALVTGLAGDVRALLDESAPVGNPDTADTAIFYSISNAQPGLAGISFGDFLIKRVVDDLAHDFNKLKTFATLSPIPGFRRWLDGQMKADPDALLLEAERVQLAGLAGAAGADGLLPRLLATADWHRNVEIATALRPVLPRLCAQYLLQAKRPDGRALDPVAHFHLSNGARMERLNWLGDTSANGLKQSAGMMLNYLYELDGIDANHEAYRGERRIAASRAMRALAKP